MRKQIQTISATVLAIVALTGAAGVQAQSTSGMMGNRADSTSLYSPGAGYIGFNAGKSNFSLNNGVGFSSEKRDNAYNLYAGSYFSNNFGVELGYIDLGRISRAGGSTKAHGFNLSLVGKVPLGTSFNLLGKVGTTYGRTSTSSAFGSGIAAGSENGFGLSYGVGAEFMFNPALSAVLQYDEHDFKFAGSGRNRVAATTVGLRYRF